MEKLSELNTFRVRKMTVPSSLLTRLMFQWHHCKYGIAIFPSLHGGYLKLRLQSLSGRSNCLINRRTRKFKREGRTKYYNWCGGCFENNWNLEICNDGEMTRERGKASHANFSSEPLQILPANFDNLQLFFPSRNLSHAKCRMTKCFGCYWF